jgi:hypothetical protein
VLALLLASAAFAQDPAPVPVVAPVVAPLPPAFDHDWKLVDARANKTYKVGVTLGLAGTGATVAGLVVGSGAIVWAGSVTEAFGLPVMSGASLRSRRALREQGAVVKATPGVLAWTLWGLGLVATSSFSAAYTAGDPSAASLGGLAVALRVGGYTAAAIQAGSNNRARYRLSLAPR